MMRKKSIVCLLLIFIVSFIFCFSGCVDNTNPDNDKKDKTPSIQEAFFITGDDCVNVTFGTDFDISEKYVLPENTTLSIFGQSEFCDNDGFVNKAGAYTVNLTAKKDDKIVCQRFIVVNVRSENVLFNTSFSENGLYWNKSSDVTFENATASLSSGENNSTLSQKNLILKAERIYELKFKYAGSGSVIVDTAFGKQTVNLAENEQLAESTTYIYSSKYTENASVLFETTSNLTISNVTFAKTNYYNDTVAPVLYGIKDKAIKFGESFNYMTNVSATDDKDGTLTGKIEVTLPSGVTANGNLLTFAREGDFEIKYSVYDNADNLTTKTRTLIVANSLPTGTVILNEDFEENLSGIYSDAYEGAEFTESIVNEDGNSVYKMDITALSPTQYQPFPRLIFGNLVNAVQSRTLFIEKNSTYTVSFRIKSSVTRSYSVNLGEILVSSPWVKYFDGSLNGLEKRTSTSAWETVTFDITTKSSANLNGALFFSFGDVNGTLTNSIGEVYLDDVKIIKK